MNRFNPLDGYVEAVLHCLKEAEKENPEAFKNMTPEERCKAGSDWAIRHIIIIEAEE